MPVVLIVAAPSSPTVGHFAGDASGDIGEFQLANKPTIWLVNPVKTIGIFEAKTKLSTLCDEIARDRVPVLLRRRGKPLAVISPVAPEMFQDRPGILDAWRSWDTEHGHTEEGDFPEVWTMRQDKQSAPALD